MKRICVLQSRPVVIDRYPCILTCAYTKQFSYGKCLRTFSFHLRCEQVGKCKGSLFSVSVF